MVVWSEAVHMRMAKHSLATKLGIPQQVADQRLDSLCSLLPGLLDAVPSMPAWVLARLASDPPGVAEALVTIKRLFPTADAAAMVVQCPALAIGGIGYDGQQGNERLAEAAALVQALLPDDTGDGTVQAHPAILLDPSGFEAALRAASARSPGVDVGAALGKDPSAYSLLLERRTRAEREGSDSSWAMSEVTHIMGLLPVGR